MQLRIKVPRFKPHYHKAKNKRQQASRWGKPSPDGWANGEALFSQEVPSQRHLGRVETGPEFHPG